MGLERPSVLQLKLHAAATPQCASGHVKLGAKMMARGCFFNVSLSDVGSVATGRLYGSCARDLIAVGSGPCLLLNNLLDTDVILGANSGYESGQTYFW